jgi:5-hydroxyisourate hydrolase-like protein (transthyretin family)
MPRNERINLKVYDAAGRLVNNLLSNRSVEYGIYDFKWNLKDADSRNVADGVYFLVLETSRNNRLSQKIIVAR